MRPFLSVSDEATMPRPSTNRPLTSAISPYFAGVTPPDADWAAAAPFRTPAIAAAPAAAAVSSSRRVNVLPIRAPAEAKVVFRAVVSSWLVNDGIASARASAGQVHADARIECVRC